MKIEIYEDGAGFWRWRLRQPNGRITADGSEGYATKPGLRRAVASFVKHLAKPVPVEEVRVGALYDFGQGPVRTTEIHIPKVSRPRAQARKG